MDVNPKIAAIVGGVAFILSFLIGLVGGVHLSVVFLHAFLFAVVFFVLAAVVTWLFATFLQVISKREKYGDLPSIGQNIDLFDNDDGGLNILSESKSQPVQDLNDNLNESQNSEIDTGSVGGAAMNGLENLGLDMLDMGEGVEQKNNSAYTFEDEQVLPKAGDDKGFSMNMGEFVSGLSGVEDVSSQKLEKTAGGSVNMGTVEMSVAGKFAGKKIELSDLGNDVDGKKVAQTIQTLLKKDEG